MKQSELKLNGKTISKVYIADNFFLRFRGLIGRNPSEIGALWIEPCSQVHTFMMSAPIDVVYVDRDGKVLKTDRNIPKSKCLKKVKNSRSVVEFPAGDAEKLGINEGDVLE